jgi:hypothetical protein
MSTWRKKSGKLKGLERECTLTYHRFIKFKVSILKLSLISAGLRIDLGDNFKNQLVLE